jgi:CheY-like chemotaxis protein
MMATALQLDGHSVLTAANGREALARLDTGVRPCLILLDLMMPVMDGWTFRDALERDPRLRTVPVVVISAAGGEMMRRVRAEAYVSKPVDIDELLHVVCEHCH